MSIYSQEQATVLVPCLKVSSDDYLHVPALDPHDILNRFQQQISSQETRISYLMFEPSPTMLSEYGARYSPVAALGPSTGQKRGEFYGQDVVQTVMSGIFPARSAPCRRTDFLLTS